MLVNEVALGNVKVGERRFEFAFLNLRFEQNQILGPIIRLSIRCLDGSFGGNSDNIGSNPPFFLELLFSQLSSSFGIFGYHEDTSLTFHLFGFLKAFRKFALDLTSPPYGYNSCHGVQGTEDEPSDFKVSY